MCTFVLIAIKKIITGFNFKPASHILSAPHRAQMPPPPLPPKFSIRKTAVWGQRHPVARDSQIGREAVLAWKGGMSLLTLELINTFSFQDKK